jgi:hypothetical protein
VRLNSAIGYITPKDMLAGHQQEIQAERDRKLEAARQPAGHVKEEPGPPEKSPWLGTRGFSPGLKPYAARARRLGGNC